MRGRECPLWVGSRHMGGLETVQVSDRFRPGAVSRQQRVRFRWDHHENPWSARCRKRKLDTEVRVDLKLESTYQFVLHQGIDLALGRRRQLGTFTKPRNSTRHTLHLVWQIANPTRYIVGQELVIRDRSIMPGPCLRKALEHAGSNKDRWGDSNETEL